MPGGRGQGFGRRRGQRRGTVPHPGTAGDILGWIQSRFLQKNIPDRSDAPLAVDPVRDPADELDQPKRQAGSLQSRLEAIHTRLNTAEQPSRLPVARVREDLCTGCKRCIRVCPQTAIAMVGNIARVNQNQCIGCGKCVPVCPSGALRTTV